jgi:hypothetical protein
MCCTCVGCLGHKYYDEDGKAFQRYSSLFGPNKLKHLSLADLSSLQQDLGLGPVYPRGGGVPEGAQLAHKF